MQLGQVNTTIQSLEASITQVLKPIVCRQSGCPMARILNKKVTLQRCQNVRLLLDLLCSDLKKWGFPSCGTKLQNEWSNFTPRIANNENLTKSMIEQAQRIQSAFDTLKSQIQEKQREPFGNENAPPAIPPNIERAPLELLLATKGEQATQSDVVKALCTTAKNTDDPQSSSHGYTLRKRVLDKEKEKFPVDETERNKYVTKEIVRRFLTHGPQDAHDFITDHFKEDNEERFSYQRCLYDQFDASEVEEREEWVDSLCVADRLPYLYRNLQTAVYQARKNDDLGPIHQLIDKLNQIGNEVPESFWLKRFIPEFYTLHFYSRDMAIEVLFRLADKDVISSYLQHVFRLNINLAAEKSMADLISCVHEGIGELEGNLRRLKHDDETVSSFLTKIMPEEIAHQLITAYFIPDKARRQKVEDEIVNTYGGFDSFKQHQQHLVLGYVPNKRIVTYCKAVLEQTLREEFSLIPAEN